MNFIAGYRQGLPALEEELIGLEQGAQKELTIPARDGFGERDESLVQTMALSGFPQGHDLEPGKWAIAKNEASGAQYSYFVSGKTSSTITVDYNHPLAGKDLYYRVNVVLVRPALAEELEFLRPSSTWARNQLRNRQNEELRNLILFLNSSIPQLFPNISFMRSSNEKSPEALYFCSINICCPSFTSGDDVHPDFKGRLDGKVRLCRDSLFGRDSSILDLEMTSPFHSPET